MAKQGKSATTSASVRPRKARPYTEEVLRGEGEQTVYSGHDAAQIAFPLGGIGTGCVCLNGHGGLQDFAIWGGPHLSASDIFSGTPGLSAAFAVLHVKGEKPVTRLVEGPFPREKVYNQGLRGRGPLGAGHEGLPRFEHCDFRGEYPFADLRMSDPKIPLRVGLRGWNPFVPLDDMASGIPCAILEYKLENRSRKPVEFEFSYHLSHLAGGQHERQQRNHPIPGKGVLFANTAPDDVPEYGSATLSVVGHQPKIKAMWFRGGWFDGLSALWRELSTGSFKTNSGERADKGGGRNGGSVLVPASLAPGESITIPVVISWHFPNREVTAMLSRDRAKELEDRHPKWRPFYAAQWSDARDVMQYVHRNYHKLSARTQAFHDALFATTAPSYVLDAVSANLGILKSTTVLRLETGEVWAYEGCCPECGCCDGSCTHVWNYAQAMPHLFPALERTMRDVEYVHSMDERGHVAFRSALPLGDVEHGFHAAADGQLGGILKVWREWQVSADHEWLERTYPLAKRSLDYCIETWDPERRGILVEPHHNTYDIEFWGPDGMCSSVYIGALSAMALLARDAGRPEDAGRYEELAERGARAMDEVLFNGDYYEHKVTWEGLRDKSFEEFMEKPLEPGDEVGALLKQEGPKYQYGSGCLSDGVIGAWMARLYGVETPMSTSHIRRNLKAIFSWNFRDDLSEHACTQRPGYAVGHEAGLLLCSWPNGGKPTLPFVYSDEVWTGIEYQVASHLILEGLVDEGLTIVKAARSRYNGHTRNPWNEYECGNYYARALASYGVLQALTGVFYSAPGKRLRVAPPRPGDSMTAFFSTASGWGTVQFTPTKLTVRVIEGKLALEEVDCALNGDERRIACGTTVKAGETWEIDIAG